MAGNPIVPIVNHEELNYWNYFLNIESDLNRIFKYVEPSQDNLDVYSSELIKIIILSCTEFENIIKIIGKLDGEGLGNMSDYKEYILKHIDKIWLREIQVDGYPLKYNPFDAWPSGELNWWNAYTGLKHNRRENFTKGTFANALYSTGALLVLLVYYYHVKVKRFQRKIRKTKSLWTRGVGLDLVHWKDLQ